jgi:uncharacterized metal-binding protein YceD (DUF177 family)
MGMLKEFEIPVQSLKTGIHRYRFELDETFFGCFEESPVEKGHYTLELELDKRENEFLLNFSISGFFESPCDRCLADIEVPSQIEKMIWVKFSDEKAGQDHDENVVYIAMHEHSFNVSELAYELIVLSLPLVRRYDCENDPNPRCDFKVLSYMQSWELENGNDSELGDKLINF